MKIKKIKFNKSFKKDLLIFLIYFLIALASIRGIIFFDGILGGHDWPSTYFTSEMQEYALNSYSWDDAFIGHPTGKTIITPYLLFYAPLSFIFSPPTIFKILILFSLCLSGFGMYKLLNSYFSLNRYASFLGGLFYLGSPFMFNNISAGFLFFIWGMAIAPFALLVFLKGISSKGIRWSLIALGVLLLSLTTQMQVSAPLLFIFLVFVLFKVIVKRIKLLNATKIAIFILILFLLLNCFWIYSIFYVDTGLSKAQDESTFESFQNKYEHSFWKESFSKKVNLLSTIRGIKSNNDLYFEGTVSDKVEPYWVRSLWTGPKEESPLKKEIIPYEIWLIVSFIILILSLASILLYNLKRNNKESINNKANKELFIIYFLFLLGVFLSKGVAKPLAFISNFLYTSPILSTLYRDPSHSAFLASLTLPILFSFTINKIPLIKPSNLFNKNFNKKTKLKKLFIIFIPFLLLLIFIYPLFTGNFAGNIHTYQIPEESQQIYHTYENEENRVWWIPFAGDIFVQEGSYRYIRDPLLPHVTGYKTFPARFLMKSFTQPEYDHKGSFLKFYNVDHVILREDYLSKNKDYIGHSHIWNRSLSEDSELQEIKKEKNIRIYENPKNLPKIYSPESVFLTDGDLRDIINSYWIPIDEGNVSFIFSKDVNKIDIFDNLLLHYPLTNIVLDTINHSYLIEPEKKTASVYAFNSWVSIRSKWWGVYEFNPACSPSDGIFTIAKVNLTIPLYIDKEGNYSLWANVLDWDNGGNLRLTFSDTHYNIDTKTDSRIIQWKKISELNLEKGTHEINIKNIEGQNAIYSLALFPESILNKKIDSFKKEIEDKNLLIYKSVEELKGTEKLKVHNFVNFENPNDKITWYYQGGTTKVGEELQLEETDKGSSAVFVKDNDNAPWIRLRSEFEPQNWKNYHSIDIVFYIENPEKVKNFKVKVNGDEGLVYTEGKKFKQGWNTLSLKLDHSYPLDWSSINKLYLELEFNDAEFITTNYSLQKVDLVKSVIEKLDFSKSKIHDLFQKNIGDWYYSGDTTSSGDKARLEKIKDKTVIAFNKDIGRKKWIRVFTEFPKEDWSYYGSISLNVSLDEPEKIKWIQIKINGDEGAWYKSEKDFKEGWNHINFKLDNPHYGTPIDMTDVNSFFIEIETFDEADKFENVYIKDVMLFSKLDLVNIIDRIKNTYDLTSKNNKFLTRNENGTILEIDLEDNVKNIGNIRSIMLYNDHKKINTPQISFEKESPSKYKVNIKNATEPFFITFSEEYNKGWGIYKGNIGIISHIFKKDIGKQSLFPSNGFTNTWYIDELGDYNLTIYYKPESAYRSLMLFSLFTAIAIIIWNIKKSNYHNEKEKDNIFD